MSCSTNRLELQQEWQGIWQSLGINPLPPTEMRFWVQKQRSLIQRAETIRVQRKETEDLEKRIGSLEGEILSELKHIGEALPRLALDLNDLIEHGQSLVDRIEKGNADRRKLETDIAEANTELGESVGRAEKADQEAPGVAPAMGGGNQGNRHKRFGLN